MVVITKNAKKRRREARLTVTLLSGIFGKHLRMPIKEMHLNCKPVAPTSGTMDSIRQITQKITNTSCWTNLFSKVTSAEALVLGARKGVHKAVLCQEISYQIRSKCHRFFSSKISSKMQSWRRALPPGRQALI